MPDTLNLPPAITTPSNNNPHSSSSFPRPKPPSSLSLPSSKPPSTSLSLSSHHTLTPTPAPLIKPLPPAKPTTTASDFESTALYLSSLGLDPLSLLPPATLAALSLPSLRSLLDYLATSFLLSPSDLRRAVHLCPSLLLLSPRRLSPVLTFLLTEALLPLPLLPLAVRRRPHLLLCSVPLRLRPSLHFLRSLGLHDLSRHPHLLSLSVEDHLLPRLGFFLALGLPLRPSVAPMFRRFPQLFCYSVAANLRPKLDYFVAEMGRDLRELVDFPHYFSFSLERRIKPRHRACVDRGVCLPLPAMLKTPEAQFRDRLDACCESSLPRSDSPLWFAHQCDRTGFAPKHNVDHPPPPDGTELN